VLLAGVSSGEGWLMVADLLRLARLLHIARESMQKYFKYLVA
jgi:hypothetical protein